MQNMLLDNYTFVLLYGSGNCKKPSPLCQQGWGLGPWRCYHSPGRGRTPNGRCCRG